MTGDPGYNPFPEDSAVMVRFPANEEELAGDRDKWSWFPGKVMAVCEGGDEWGIILDDDEDALIFRDAGEMRKAE